jgi:hypothetical protein
MMHNSRAAQRTVLPDSAMLLLDSRLFPRLAYSVVLYPSSWPSVLLQQAGQLCSVHKIRRNCNFDQQTGDNLNKRNLNKPECCVFCAEPESIHHLFFNCIVAKQIWVYISSFFELPIGDSYESVARFWISNKKHALLNSVCANAL